MTAPTPEPTVEEARLVASQAATDALAARIAARAGQLTAEEIIADPKAALERANADAVKHA